MRIHSLLLSLTILLAGCSPSDAPEDTQTSRSEQTNPVKPVSLAFVGTQQCVDCHQQEYRLWLGSHHDLAMGLPTNESVVGDFSDTTHTYGEVTSTFYREGETYWVRTDNADGELEAFPIAYTFGVEPLQQYLIGFPGGRLQALNVVWDNRSAANGGQRWTHLYPHETIDHADPLHWTGRYQNWNFMCSECHSTNLEKGYRPVSDTFETQWSEINVACEACHGPGSRHVQWAGPASATTKYKNKGLVAPLTSEPHAWTRDGAQAIAKRIPPRTTPAQQPEGCGRCHARRSQLSEDYRYNKPLADTHRPALLSAPLYYDDGQIAEEVYVYGSFLQSKMYAAGVTCTDCHDAHSLELKAPGNALCATCHAPQVYDAQSHHQHSAEALQCVDCHMPARTFMAVDDRRDHSFRIPRPDLSVALDTPNACNSCHADKRPEWAAGMIESWYPGGAWTKGHFATAFASARSRQPDALRRLEAIASDNKQPAIVRATALSEMSPLLRPGFEEIIMSGAKDPAALVRLGAIDAMDRLPPEVKVPMAAPLLQDAVLAVRVAAAETLAAARPRMNAPTAAVFDAAARDYVAAQNTNAERPESHINLGSFYAATGQVREAESAFKRALFLAPEAVPAIVNLADLYRQTGQESQAEALLRDSIDRISDHAALAHALGLLLARRQNLDESLSWLRVSSELAPENERYLYVLGVALNSSGQTDAALQTLEAMHKRFPANTDALWALATMNRDAGNAEGALHWLQQLLDMDPGHQQALQLRRALSEG